MSTNTTTVYKRKQDPFILKLIEEFKKHNCMWNVGHKEYHNKFLVKRAWLDLAAKMDNEVPVLRSKWKNLKDSYRKEVKKNIVDNEYQGTWLYFENMDFLRDKIDIDPIDKDKNDTDTIEEIYLGLSSSEQSNQSDQYLTNFNRKRKRDTGTHETSTYQQSNEGFKIDDDEERFDEQFLVSLLPFLRRLDPIRKLMVRSKMQAAVVEELSQSTRDPIAH